MRALFQEFLKTISYCKPHKRLYFWGLAALLLVDIADVAAPLLIKIGVGGVTERYTSQGVLNPDYDPSFIEAWLPADAFSAEGWYHGAWIFGLLYFAVIAFAGYFRFWMSFNFSRAMISVTNDLRNRMFDHVQRLPAKWHDRSTVGKVMSLATNDVDACRFFWGFGLLLAVDVLLYVIFTPILMLSISWELTLICGIPMLGLPWVIAKLAHAIEERFERVQDQFSVLSDQASESFNGAKVVKSFAAEPQEVKRFGAMSKEYLRKALRLAKVHTLEDPLLVLFIGAVQLIVFAYGGYLVLQGELATSAFVAFFFFVLRLAFPMIELGWVIMMYQRCVVSRRRIEELLAEEVSIRDADDARIIERPRGEIVLRNLTFEFFGGEGRALYDLNLTIPAGSTLGIVGEVGAGKSALLGLIPRLYDPPPGTIFIDGVDVRKLKLDWLRQHVAMVPQETFLFSETIYENLAFGLTHITPDPEKIKEYARLAQVEEDILNFPNKYETLLGERGVNLSGGQKQRVAIARALACEPLILLLDDCLSAVDAKTEDAILGQLRGAMRKRTSLIVSHRVSTVMQADRIIVLEKGEIVEQGTHDQLAALDGWYADLCRKQQLEAEIEQE